MKKFLFPLFKDRHKFLSAKWWFRLITVIYLTLLVISPFYIFLNYMDSQTSWCYGSLYLFSGEPGFSFDQQLKTCKEVAQDARIPAISFGIIGSLAIHYFVQLLFFKIIIDFIVLGGKARYEI